MWPLVCHFAFWSTMACSCTMNWTVPPFLLFYDGLRSSESVNQVGLSSFKLFAWDISAQHTGRWYSFSSLWRMSGLSQELGLRCSLREESVASAHTGFCLHHLLLPPGHVELILNAKSLQCHTREIKRRPACLANALTSAWCWGIAVFPNVCPSADGLAE